MRLLSRSLFLLAALSAAAIGGPARAADAPAKKKIVFVAGGASHGFMSHDHLAGCTLLADRVNATPGYAATVHAKGWPAADAFDGAAAVVVYSDGGKNHIAIPHKDQLKALSAKGVGVGFIHYAVEVPKEMAGREWLDVAGGYFEAFHSVNPHWLGQFNELTKHPVTNGVKPFQTQDEWYYHMRFRDEMKGVRPILSAVPPDKSRQGKDGPHSGNPDVRAGVGKSLLEHVMWVSENAGDPAKDAAGGEPVSRGFGCTGGHWHKNWASDPFRRTVLNAIVWIANGEVPEAGVESKRPDVEELLSNRDPGVAKEQVPADFDRAKLAAEIEQMNKPYDPKIVKPTARRPAAPGEELLEPLATR